jgi:hypothetical protein
MSFAFITGPYSRYGVMSMANFAGEPWHADTAFHCPVCGYKHDAVSSATGQMRVPTDGDFSICFRCGEITRFVVTSFGVSVRKLTHTDTPFIPPDAFTARATIRDFWKKHPEQEWSDEDAG